MGDSYYGMDFDLEELLVTNGLVEDYFYIQDLKQRKLYCIDEISDSLVSGLVRHILQYNREDIGLPVEDRKPITLYICSPGGSVDAGFQLIDAIRNSKTPVYTVNQGHWYSMALLIGIAGHKRFAFRNAKFLLHDGSNFVYDSGAKVQDRLEFTKKEEERSKEYIISMTKLEKAEYDEKYRVEWYMFADEAKEKGFIDCIIGEDCDIDAII